MDPTSSVLWAVPATRSEPAAAAPPSAPLPQADVKAAPAPSPSPSPPRPTPNGLTIVLLPGPDQPHVAGRARRWVARGLEITSELLGMAVGASAGLVAGAALGGVYGLGVGVTGREPAHLPVPVQLLLKSTQPGQWVNEKVTAHAGRVVGGVLGGVVGGAVGTAMGLAEGATWGAILGMAEARGACRATGIHGVAHIEDNPVRSGPPVRVAAIKGAQKIPLMDQVIDASGFLPDLEKKWQASGKSKADFVVAVKPNLMMFTHPEDPPVTYTDPELVEHLIDRIQQAGYANVRMVEAQNVYGNWFANRTVDNVARVAGYHPTAHHYTIHDLTTEQEDFDYGGRLGQHSVGRTWRDADYRISFAKNKTHVSSLFTLSLKNVYGCLPKQDKALEYHGKREWDKSTVDNLRNFKVDFGFIDGTYSADGALGFKGTALAKPTRMIYGGADPIAVDMVAGRHMGLDPRESKLVKLAIKALGEPRIEYAGNVPPDYVHDNWDNVWPGMRGSVPQFIERSVAYKLLEGNTLDAMQHLMDVGEETYAGFNTLGMISNDMAGNDHMDPAFPMLPVSQMAPHVVRGMMENVRDFVKDKKHREDIKEDLKDVL